MNTVEQCPSPSANLAVFAAINVAMLIFTPLLGRRTFVNKLTMGMLGQPGSQFGWRVVGPLTVAMQVMANGINIALIKSIPEYANVSAGRLMMLWLARPRLGWLAVVLVPREIDKSMYVSCASSALSAEIILQLLTAYSMGTTANYGRIIGGIYEGGSRAAAVDALATGHAARAMYGGALTWLVAIFFTVILLVTVVLKVSNITKMVVVHMEKDEESEDALILKAEALLSEAISHDQLVDMYHSAHDNSRGVYVPACEILLQSSIQLSNITQTTLQELEALEDEFKRQSNSRAPPLFSLDGLRHKVIDVLFGVGYSPQNYTIYHFLVGVRDDEPFKKMREDMARLRYNILATVQNQLRALQYDKTSIRLAFPLASRYLSFPKRKPRYPWKAYWGNSGIYEYDLFYIHEVVPRNYQPTNNPDSDQMLGFQSWPEFQHLGKALVSRWTDLKTKCSSRTRTRKQGLRDKSQNIIRITVIGISICWIAQWLFWGGLVHLYGSDG
jgi:hypothetical protein